MLVYRQKIIFKLLEIIGKLQNIKWTQQIASECSYTQRREWSGSGGGCQRNINYSDSNEIIGLSDRVFPSSGWLYIDGCVWSGNEMLSVKWRSEELSNSMKSLVNSFVMLCEFEKWHENVLPSIFHIIALCVWASLAWRWRQPDDTFPISMASQLKMLTAQLGSHPPPPPCSSWHIWTRWSTIWGICV